MLDAEGADLLGEIGGIRFDRGQGEAELLLALIGAGFGRQQPPDLLGSDLVVLVEAAQHRGDVGESDAAGEALEQPAVVDDDPDRRHTERGEPGEGIGDRQRDLDFEVAGQVGVADDVDVGLDELAVPAGLGALPTPHRLDPGGPEREAQLVRVLRDETGERDGEVEVEAERVAFGTLGVEAGDGEDLLVDLPVLGQLAQGFDGTVVQGGEAVQGEGVAEDVDDALLDHCFGREPFRESGQTG